MKNFWKKFLIWNIIIDASFILGALFHQVCIAYTSYVVHLLGSEDTDKSVYQGLINKGEKYAKMFHLL